MAVPKRRHSRARGRRRRTHQVLVAPKLIPCRHCHQMIPPHTVCAKCGSYGGRIVAPPKTKKKKTPKEK